MIILFRGQTFTHSYIYTGTPTKFMDTFIPIFHMYENKDIEVTNVYHINELTSIFHKLSKDDDDDPIFYPADNNTIKNSSDVIVVDYVFNEVVFHTSTNSNQLFSMIKEQKIEETPKEEK